MKIYAQNRPHWPIYKIPFGSSSEAEVIHVTMQTQVKNSKWHIDIFSTLNCGGIIL